MEKTRLESIVAEIENNPCYDEEKHGLLLVELGRFFDKLEDKPSRHVTCVEPWADKRMMDVELCNSKGECFNIILDEGLFHWEVSLVDGHFFEENVPYSENCFDEIAEIVNKNF